jgi:hypothetical protein
MNQPNIIVAIHYDLGGDAQNPAIGQLRPGGINLENRNGLTCICSKSRTDKGWSRSADKKE